MLQVFLVSAFVRNSAQEPEHHIAKDEGDDVVLCFAARIATS